MTAMRETGVHDFEMRTLQGETVPMASFAGKVLLLVNTASQCGFTPQYAGLQALHERFAERGFSVIGFPCNQFGAQEPGDADEIGQFCETRFGVRFPLSEKVDVNGANAHPLWAYLTSEAPGLLGTEMIKWNFTKFLVDRNGKVVSRHAPTTTPDALAAEIEKLLA